ncbi:MAG: L-2-amino-thiazoline-4-carboxylic acid hydrolase [Planctomycetes bacterium]|nr:L-2-amino-thiazoline-4-carboxylic acid hydrolase [Planctomycetota bacterium]
MRPQETPSYYIDDHAMLFAYLVRNAESACGEAGLAASVKGTILYGRERGLRMAMRCRADGRPLTPRNYLLYGEWVDDRGWSAVSPGCLKPFVLDFNRCGWSDVWKQHGMEKYGAIYCSLIDQELVRGFNPDNALRIDKTRPQGADICSFCFIGADFDSEEEYKKDGEIKAKLRARTVKDFLYHTAHLLSALRRTYLVELGLVKADEIVSTALADYGKEFGQKKANAVAEESKQDFLVV